MNRFTFLALIKPPGIRVPAVGKKQDLEMDWGLPETIPCLLVQATGK